MSKQTTNKKKVKIPGTQEEKIKYVFDVTLWPLEEVKLVLEECNWDVQLAVNNIADGRTKEWTVVQQKAKPKAAAPKEGGKKGEGVKESSNARETAANKKNKDDSHPRRSESEGARGKSRAYPQRAQEGPQQNQTNSTQPAQENGTTQTPSTTDLKNDNTTQLNRQNNRGGGRGGRTFQNQYLPHSASKPKAHYGYQHPPGRGRPFAPQRYHTQPPSEQDKGNTQQALLQQAGPGFRPNQQFNANHKPPRPPHFSADGNSASGPEKGDASGVANPSSIQTEKKEHTLTAPVSQPHNVAQPLLQAPQTHPSGPGAVSTPISNASLNQTAHQHAGSSQTATNSSTSQVAPAGSATPVAQQQTQTQIQQAGNFQKTNQAGKPGSQWKAKDVQGHWKSKDTANSQAPRQANPQHQHQQPQPQQTQPQHQPQPQPQPQQQQHVSHVPIAQPQVKSEETSHKNEGTQLVEQPRPSQVPSQTSTQAQQHSTQIPSVNSEQSVNVNQSFSRYFNRTPVSLPVGIDVPSFKFQFGNSETATEESNPIGRFEQNQVEPQFQALQPQVQTQTKAPEATPAQNQHAGNQAATQANIQNPNQGTNVLQLGNTQQHSQEPQTEETHENSVPPFQQYGFLPGHYVMPPLQHYGYDPEKATDLGRIPPTRPYYEMPPFPASYSSTSPNHKFPISSNLNNNQNRNEKYNNSENATSQTTQQAPPSTSPTAQSQQHAYPASLAAQYSAPLYHGYPYLPYSQGYPSASGAYSIPAYPRMGMYKPLPSNYPNYPHPSYPSSGYPEELSLDYYHGVPPQHPMSYYMDPTVSAASKNQQSTQINNGNSSKSTYSSPPNASSSNHGVENYKAQDYKSTYASGRENAQANPYNNYASPYGQPYPYAQTAHVLPGQNQSGTQTSQSNNYQPNRNQNYS